MHCKGYGQDSYKRLSQLVSRQTVLLEEKFSALLKTLYGRQKWMYPAIFVNMNCIDELHYRLEQPDSWRYIQKPLHLKPSMVGPPGGSCMHHMACCLFCYLFGSYACSRECNHKKEFVGLQDLLQSVRICMLMLTLPRVRYLISPTGLGVMQRLPHSVAWK